MVNNKYIHIILLIIIVLQLLYLFNKYSNSFVVESFATNITTQQGNSLLKRDLSNFKIVNSGINDKKQNILIDNSTAKGITLLPKGEIQIMLSSPTRIDNIYLTGLQKFKLIVDDNDEIELSTASTNIVTPRTAKGNKLVASTKIRIINGENKNISNIKFDIYGMDETATDYSETVPDGLIKSNNYAVKKNNNQIDILFNIDYLVSKIELLTAAGEIKLSYQNSLTTDIGYYPCGDDGEMFNVINNETMKSTIYLNNPTLMKKLTIYNSSPQPINNIQIYGKSTTGLNKADYIAQSKCNAGRVKEDFRHRQNNRDDFEDIIENPSATAFDGTTSFDDISNLNKLCSAIEYQDSIQNEQIKLDKQKQYYIKLQRQEDEIRNLELQIQKLKDIKDKRVSNDDLINLAKFETQTNEQTKLNDLINQKLRTQPRLNVDVNLQPN